MLGKSILICTLFSLSAVGCDDGTASADMDYTALLTSLTGTAVKQQQSFADTSDALVTALMTFETSADAGSLAAAQAAWRAARAAYRQLDALQFGPIADNAIGDAVDLAPATPADIEAVIAGTATIDVTAVGMLGGKAKGFLGMQYLLFSSDGDAAALTKAQSDIRRRTFARAMAQEVAAKAHQIVDAWSSTGADGGYAQQILTAGTTSKRYPRQRGAVDDFVGGVGFSMEYVVGIRLAEPLGHKGNGMPDPSQDFTALSDSAVADMTASTAGVTALYMGTGFDSIVREKNMSLDKQAMMEMSDCAAKISAIPPPFDTSLTANTADVQAAYDSCKALKLTWNTDLTSALGATLLPSDNDGD